MSIAYTLAKHNQNKNPIDFDPSKDEHQKAFLKLFIEGKQHDNLRFHADRPFSGAPQMMLMAMGLSKCEDLLKEVYGLSVEEAMLTIRNNSVDDSIHLRIMAMHERSYATSTFNSTHRSS